MANRKVTINSTDYFVLESNVKGKSIGDFEYLEGDEYTCEEINCQNDASYRLPEGEDDGGEDSYGRPSILRKVKSSYTCDYLCKDCFKKAFPDMDLGEKDSPGSSKTSEPESKFGIFIQHDDEWHSFANLDQVGRFLKSVSSDIEDNWASHCDVVIRFTKHYKEDSE